MPRVTEMWKRATIAGAVAAQEGRYSCWQIGACEAACEEAVGQ